MKETESIVWFVSLTKTCLVHVTAEGSRSRLMNGNGTLKSLDVQSKYLKPLSKLWRSYPPAPLSSALRASPPLPPSDLLRYVTFAFVIGHVPTLYDCHPLRFTEPLVITQLRGCLPLINQSQVQNTMSFILAVAAEAQPVRYVMLHV